MSAVSPASSRFHRLNLSRWHEFSELWLTRLESLVDRVLSLTLVWARRRLTFLEIIFIVTWLGLAWLYHPWTNFSKMMSDAMVFLVTLYVPPGQANPLHAVFFQVWGMFFSLDVLSRMLVIWFPGWVAYRVAAIYLDDIFELDNVRVAGRFIRQAAFAEEYDLITIEEGSVSQTMYENSPIIRIGGPGRVRVSLDNAALFERMDGTTHIAGPSFKQYRSMEVLEGFERLRKIVDLRDQIITKLDVKGRTRDGIRVSATNMRLVFSVDRKKQPSSLQQPFPFSERAIHDLIYQDSVRLPMQNGGGKKKLDIDLSDKTLPLANTVQVIIQREMTRFISEHTLGQFLAAIGSPEHQFRAEILDEIRHDYGQLGNFGSSNQEGRHGKRRSAGPRRREWRPPQRTLLVDHSYHAQGTRKVKPRLRSQQAYRKQRRRTVNTGKFVHRPQITEMFRKYMADSPNPELHDRVQLDWIDVGTWGTPAGIIPSRHLEAWKLSQENLIRNNPQEIEEIQISSRVNGLLHLLQEVPLLPFRQLLAAAKGKDEIIFQLLNNHLLKLYSARDVFYQQNADVPKPLEHAIAHLRAALKKNGGHWLG